MGANIRSFEFEIKTDELGEFEETSWDLSPKVSPHETMHLDQNGLPKIGVQLEPGMILFGRIGKAKAYATDRKPTDLEIHSLSFTDLNEQFGHLWTDSAERVPLDVHGTVIESEIELRPDGKKVAVVRVNLQ